MRCAQQPEPEHKRMNKHAKKIAALENNLENKLPKLEKKLLSTLADPPNQNFPANAEDPREFILLCSGSGC